MNLLFFFYKLFRITLDTFIILLGNSLTSIDTEDVINNASKSIPSKRSAVLLSTSNLIFADKLPPILPSFLAASREAVTKDLNWRNFFHFSETFLLMH